MTYSTTARGTEHQCVFTAENIMEITFIYHNIAQFLLETDNKHTVLSKYTLADEILHLPSYTLWAQKYI